MSDLSAVERFEPHRGRLFAVAYRMTGSVVDAEDCIQEAFVRWQRVDLDTVQNDEAYLVRVTSRLAIDRQRQAARRRETYVGPWLPEPLLAPLGTAPASPLSSPEHEVELARSARHTRAEQLKEAQAALRALDSALDQAKARYD